MDHPENTPKAVNIQEITHRLSESTDIAVLLRMAGGGGDCYSWEDAQTFCFAAQRFAARLETLFKEIHDLLYGGQGHAV